MKSTPQVPVERVCPKSPDSPIGLCDEYPAVPYADDWERSGYDGVLEPGMAVCVESYVGRQGGHEGVKLEEQVLITETGVEMLSRYPRDARLSGRA